MRPRAGRNNLAVESDADLLRRFVDGRDESAFACLVARHSSLVLGACNRMLKNRHDAEDAFQAVFLTLSCKAKSLRKVRSLPGWLYGVAVRICLNVRRANNKWNRAVTGAQDNVAAKAGDAHPVDAIGALDEELARLPERFRDVLLFGAPLKRSLRFRNWSAPCQALWLKPVPLLSGDYQPQLIGTSRQLFASSRPHPFPNPRRSPWPPSPRWHLYSGGGPA
jgi:RNA polymerase sigma factor (sigma-70 family)